MLHIAHAWLAVIVDISIKSILLAGTAALAIFVLRVRDANLRHRIWTSVLLGMLAMPALVRLVPAVPLPGWISLTIADESPRASFAGVDSGEPDAVALRSEDKSAAEGMAGPPQMSPNVPATSPIDSVSADAVRAMQGHEVQTAGKSTAQRALRVDEHSTSTSWFASRWLLLLLSVYCTGAIAFITRIIVGLLVTRRLARQSKELHLAIQPRLARRRSLRLAENESIHVPSTIGVIRPVVLLPAAWRQWSESKLQAVLAHEFAHVRRADWFVITLAELNRAMYWFHPIAWIVKRQLSELAELNCDDAVLEANGDPAQYARYLLEVAASLTAAGARYRRPLQGVAMARQSNVETRINAILDAGRPLAHRLGAWGIMGLVMIGLPAVLLAAALQSASDSPKQMAARGVNPPAAKQEMKEGTAMENRAPAAADQHQNESAKSSNRQHVTGRVLGPDGRPTAGANVAVVWGLTRQDPPSYRAQIKTVAETSSDADGKFELEFSNEHPDRTRLTSGWQIVASAPGYGPAWLRDVHAVKDSSSNTDVTLTLATDQPIHGRIVDLEGNPLEGIQVRIHSLRLPEDEGQLLDWIKDSKERAPPSKLEEYFENSFNAGSGKYSPYPGPFPTKQDSGQLGHGSPGIPADVKTDKEGRFEFGGIGQNRLAVLELEGSTIAKCFVHVVTRDMKTVYAQPAEFEGLRAGTYFGREFQFVAEPSQLIEGTVSDIETDKPLPHVEVCLYQFAESTLVQNDFLVTETDDQGHYRLTGAPRGGGHRIQVSPIREQQYFPTSKRIAKASGFDPIKCDFALRRGQWINGKVTDQETGAPLSDTNVEYLPLRSNKFAEDYPNYDPQITGAAPSGRYHTGPDGTFRVLAIPGTGILGAIAKFEDQTNYSIVREDTIPKHLIGERGNLATYHPWVVSGYHALREIELAKSDQDTAFDLQLTRGLTRKIKLIDANGQSVTGVRTLGRRFASGLSMPTEESTVEIIGLRATDERDVVFIHPERRIGKAMTVGTGEEMTVQLEPCAIARGRVVDDEKQPLRGLKVNVTYNRPDNWQRALIPATTGDDGQFEVLLPPGTTYRIWHYMRMRMDFSAECNAKAGAVFELGDLTDGTKLTVEQTRKMIGKGDSQRASAPSDAKRSVIHGQITGPDDKPAASADVAVIATRVDRGRGGDLDPPGVVLAETKTNAEGKYELSLAGASSKSYLEAHIVARADKTGLVWKALNLDANDSDIPLQLSREETITGKFVDIEGQPAAGVRFRVPGISPRVSGDAWPAGGIGIYAKQLPAAWPQPAPADDAGHFTITGVPKDFGVHVEIEESDKFAPQSLLLNTGMSEQRGERDGTYRPQVVKNLKPGEEAVLPLAPAQLFTGTVRFEDTGEPAPHARLTIWASQQKFGSMISVAGKADRDGHYKITPNPGIRFGVTAYPPDGTPYLARELQPISWKTGDRSRDVDVKLPRGVLVRGQVLEQENGAPIVGASIQYHPEEVKNSTKPKDVLTGWQDIHATDKQGRFEIVVLPGPGRLLIHAPQNDFVFQEISERELDNGRVGGRRYYAHAIERIEPVESAPPIDLTVGLKRGATIGGELVDGQGATIKEALIISRLYISPLSAFWRGFPHSATEGRFEVAGLAADQEYPIYFLDSKQRLGATLIAKAGMPAPQVVLQPCGSAKMRFVDEAGKPVASFEPTVFMVVTPGAVQLSAAARSVGTIAADEDFISNIDRANHKMPEKADADGRMTVSALVPDATYRILVFRKQMFELGTEFKAKAGETIDLGDIRVERPE